MIRFFLKLIFKPFGCLLSLLFTLLLVAGICLIIGIWGAGKWGPDIAARTIESRTGFPTTIGSHDVNLFAGRVDLRSVQIGNSSAFPHPEFFEAAELSISASPTQLIGSRKVIDRAVIDISKVTYVVSADRENNVHAFAEALAGPRKKPAEPTAEDEPEYLIRELVFRLDTVAYEDFSRRSPLERDYHLNYARTFTNVTDVPNQVIQPIIRDLSNKGVNFLLSSFVVSLLEFDTYTGAAEELIRANRTIIESGTDIIGEGGAILEDAGRRIRSLFE